MRSYVYIHFGVDISVAWAKAHAGVATPLALERIEAILMVCRAYIGAKRCMCYKIRHSWLSGLIAPISFIVGISRGSHSHKDTRDRDQDFNRRNFTLIS